MVAGASVTSLADYAQPPWPAPAAPVATPVGIPVAIVSADPRIAASLRAKLNAAAGVRLIEDPSARAGIIVWAAPPSDPGELPVLPLDPAHHAGHEPPAVIALISDTTDPLPLLAAGVRGLLDTNVEIGRLRAAIIAVQLGLSVLDEDPADAIVAAWSPSRQAPANDHLTPREQQVLEHLAEGLSNRAIGQALGISAHTVKFHVDALLDKLGARSRTQVVVKAIRAGLLRL
ncbi:DNA-binding response regulator, LuxR family protein [Enhygromyxa salina]|uniref:DNA-binding response regulator, LuxR family protein n=1 Tax=Enhygromyxa salina TaxID=215803 RepID=A0A0C1ZYK9_9BACT|nr:DNA-binding response regulator, LuxR family protein [Enhygromyxa salina]